MMPTISRETETDHAILTNLPMCERAEKLRVTEAPLVRRVVLVTDDVNLRVKALARYIPVRGLAAFARIVGVDQRPQ